jgi:hypothetical protein
LNISLKKIAKDILFSCLLVIVFCYTISPFQYIANESLDPSWSNSYNYFFDNHFQFGNQIAFTYGPLAFLYVKAFDPNLYWAKLLFTTVLALITCTGLFYVKRNINFSSSIILSIGLIICSQHDSFVFSLQLLLTLTYLFRKTTSVKKDNIYITFLFAIIAFLGFIKFTFWVSGLLLALIFASRYILVRDWRRFSTGILSFFLFSIFIWLTCNQSLSNFGYFIKNGIEIASGYNDAMSISGPLGDVYVALIIIIIIIMVIPLQITKNYMKHLDQLLLLLSIFAFTFLSWKHGFVRQDLHKVEFYSFMSFVYALFFSLNTVQINVNELRIWLKTKKIIRIFHDEWIVLFTSERLKQTIAVIMIIFSVSALGYSFNHDLFAKEYIHSKLNDLRNTAYYVFRPNSAVENKNRLMLAYAQTKENLQLPQIKKVVGGDSIDIYNYNQNYIIYNDLNWNPRPVFQSYSAYSSKLLKMNENNLTQTNPKYILFNNQTIDNRYPLLDDSLWVREVLHQYNPIQQQSGLILMQKSNIQKNTPQLISKKSLEVQLNKPIDINLDNDITYATIDITYNLLGKVRALFYKPTEIYLTIKLTNGQEKSFRIVPGMTKEPFLLSPLNENNDDIMQTMTGINPKIVKSINIQSPNGDKFINNNAEVTLYQDQKDVKSDIKKYQKIMWSDIILRPADKIIFENSLERVQAYDSSWMLFHPKAEMEFNLKPEDKTASALIGLKPEVKEVGKSDGVTFFWEAKSGDEWIRLSSININQENFSEQYLKFAINLPNDRKYSVLRLRVDSGPTNNGSWDWAIIKDINIE